MIFSIIKRLARYGFVVLSYFSLALFFCRGVIVEKGILMGGDWAFPQSTSGMYRFAQSGFFTWSDREFFGVQQSFLNSLPFHIVIGFFAKLGLTGDIYSKVLLITAFVFPALSMYAFCRFIKCSRFTSFFGGFLYMTLPFFFNYAAMGWLFVLFSMGILPLALILFSKSVQEKNISYSILTGFLFALAMIQSQSFIWFPLAFLAFGLYLVTDKKSLFDYIKSLVVVFLVFLGLGAFWHLSLFLGGGGRALNTNLAASTVSLGTWARLSGLNIIRGWGSLFNEPYEGSTSFYTALTFLSFMLPLTAYSSLFVFKKNRLVSTLIVLSFIPITLFALGPGFIVRLPFSDVIRDIARFSVISSFAYVALAALVLNALFNNPIRKVKILAGLICFLLVAGTYSFWSGELFGQERLGYDIRLRTYNFPPEYALLEKELQKDTEDVKVLYLPITGEISITDDKRFYGSYKGIRDITASYSPKPGLVGLSDRNKGVTAEFLLYVEKQMNELPLYNLTNLLALMNTKYVVVRKNMTHPAFAELRTGKDIADQLKVGGELTLVRDWDKIALFENKNVLPHIYIPQNLIITKEPIASLPYILSAPDYIFQSAIYFVQQNTKEHLNESGLQTNVKPQDQSPNLEFKKIDPTKYRLTVRNITQSFPLVFSEMYHANWKLYPAKINSYESSRPEKIYETWFQKSLPDKNHLIANGYANSWVVDPASVCKSSESAKNTCRQNEDGSFDMEFTIEFSSQKYFYIGAIISVITIGISTLLVLFIIARKKYDRN